MMMTMMQYTNCVVKAHELKTVKLALYKYKIQILITCTTRNKQLPRLFTMVYNNWKFADW